MPPDFPALFHPRPPSARQCLRPSRTPDFSSSVMLSPHVSSDAKDGEFALGRGRPSVTKDSLHGRWNSAALQDFSPVHVRIGSNPKLPHRNIDGRFTSINGHYVGRIYLRCRPANLLALPSLLAFTRRRRRRFRRKGWPPPTVGTPGQLTTCRRVPQECHAPPSPLQWPVVTHNRPPVAL